MKVEIHYNCDREPGGFRVQHSPQHRTLLHYWGSPDGVEFPYVLEVSEEETQRLLKAFEEYHWAQQRLRELAKGKPPQKCQCGNCPA